MSLLSNLFGQKFGLTERDLERYLAEALSKGGDYADLYFEYLATSSISLDESLVKSATQGVSLGVGIRVLSGERTGYAYSDAMKKSGVTWDEATLDRFIESPDAVVGGNNMKPYTGMTSQEDRAAIIAFLKAQ